MLALALSLPAQADDGAVLLEGREMLRRASMYDDR
jgi:hypothetical protein